MDICKYKGRRSRIAAAVILSAILSGTLSASSAAAASPVVEVSSDGEACLDGEVSPSGQEEEAFLKHYRDYRERLARVVDRAGMEENDFLVIEDQVFPLETKCFGRVSLIPAIEKQYSRLVLFFTREDGTVVYRTDQLEVNSRNAGELEQPVRGISAVSFQDLNGDGLLDIVFISECINKKGAYAGNKYRTGDVLFQNKTGFYRDYRISDKINRFDMNKSVESIIAFVRDGDSTEFLYTAATKQELLENGFRIIEEQCYPRQFEKLGWLEVVPGTYSMANYSTFMIYLINEEGYIVWSFQPMGDYDDLYALMGITCRDIDGDGMKDILLLARFGTVGSDNVPVIESSFSIYYQRTGGFYTDTEVKKAVSCSDDDTVAGLVEKARAYWGWKSAL